METYDIETGSFAEACYNMNSIDELKAALLDEPDESDMKTWGIDANEYTRQCGLALNALVQEKG